jgi:hypothetical protein
VTDWLRRLDRALLPPVGRVLERLARGARRLRLLTVVGLTSALTILLVAVWTADQAPLADPSQGEVVRVGVASGQSVPDYVDQSRRRLAGLVSATPAGGTEIYALVSLRAYLAPDRLAAVLGGVAVSRVYARVPLPHTQTEIVRIDAYRVPHDVITGMRAEAARKDAQAQEYRRHAARLDAASPRYAQERRVYTTGAAVAADEATAYRRLCSCVYAAVVRGNPAALGLIARRAEVRAVDPAPAVLRLDRAVFLPPLPEQVGLAVPPDDSAVDPPSPTAPGPTPEPSTTPSDSVADASGPGGTGGGNAARSSPGTGR